MRRLYSLTGAEAELVKLLVEGASIRQAAERRGVATATARSQLKSVFSKTGTKRQGELVQLVLSGLMAIYDQDEVAYRENQGLGSSAEMDE